MRLLGMPNPILWGMFLVGRVYWGLAIVEGSFASPMILGRRLENNAVVLILALMIWGWIWDIGGALLAVPLLAAFKIMCDHLELLQPSASFWESSVSSAKNSCELHDDTGRMRTPMYRRWIIALALALCTVPGLARAESSPQSVHWGAIAFPDHDPTLTLSTAVLDRFTQFDGAGKRYNDINQTMGFNFFTVSWTKPLTQWPGWNLNLTAGGGPTRDGPSRFLQNDVVHKLRGFDPVPVGEKRDANDFMLSGTMTRWFGLLGTSDVFFAGVGGAGGSLYYEPYVQAGFRRLAILNPIPLLGDYLRVSALARYGRPFSGAAFHQVAPQSYLAQASVGLGNYHRWKDSTPWEIELAVTVDSGLFVDHRGDALEERFVSVAVRYSAFTFETWNDLINQKDYGPTFGARLTLDLFYMYDRWFH